MTAVALVAIASCDAESLGGKQCITDAHCTAGRTCEFSHCIQPGTNRAELAARIVPSSGSGLVEQQVPMLDLTGGPSLSATLVEPVVMQGFVLKDDGGFTNVAGNLTAKTKGEIPGTDFRFTARSVDGVSPEGYGYRLFMLPGRDYEITFRADDPSIPPHTFQLPAAEVTSAQRDILLPASQWAHVKALVRGENDTGVKGAKVTAILEDGTVTTNTTSNDEGYIELYLPAGTTQARYRVEPGETGDLFPVYTTDLKPVIEGTDTINIPQSTAEEIEARIGVRAMQPDGTSVPVAGTRVTVELKDGSLRRQGTTDAAGVANITTLAGYYWVLVSPAPSEPFATTIGEAAVNLTDSQVVDFVVPMRDAWSGQVVDSLGTPVPSGTVEAVRRDLPSYEMHGLVPSSGPFTAPIVNGAFSLLVDPGTYDVRVQPNESAGPAKLLKAQTGTPMTVQLHPPGLVHMKVHDPMAKALSGATVEIYVPGPEPGTPWQLLTKGTTSDGGAVDLLVPFVP